MKPVRQTPPLNKIAEEVILDDDGDDSDHYVELPALAGDYINKGQQPPPPSGKEELSVREEPRVNANKFQRNEKRQILPNFCNLHKTNIWGKKAQHTLVMKFA